VAGERFVIWVSEGKEATKRKTNYCEPVIGRPEEQ
jgi:hypothetical protein